MGLVLSANQTTVFVIVFVSTCKTKKEMSEGRWLPVNPRARRGRAGAGHVPC